MQLARTIIQLARARGTFQLSGPRDISYSEAAHFLARRFGADARLIEETSARDGDQPPEAAALYTSLDSSALCALAHRGAGRLGGAGRDSVARATAEGLSDWHCQCSRPPVTE